MNPLVGPGRFLVPRVLDASKYGACVRMLQASVRDMIACV